jgi:hypothetical protein
LECKEAGICVLSIFLSCPVSTALSPLHLSLLCTVLLLLLFSSRFSPIFFALSGALFSRLLSVLPHSWMSFLCPSCTPSLSLTNPCLLLVLRPDCDIAFLTSLQHSFFLSPSLTNVLTHPPVQTVFVFVCVCLFRSKESFP